eukprot:TRINITY_DN80912_c1_g1_i1.p1 TRINITY_DN80912_c1_g1~~TRINITY_DN80912_c1_g1_i1.p1  ORF type:complete len:133 (+),score=18.10 TRINITY_DN80912_c1_g1_i1:1-399(+)
MDASPTKNKELESFFEKVIGRVPGLRAVFLSDFDGVNLLKVSKEEVGEKEFLASTFSSSTNQASKLQFGQNNHIISFFAKKTIVHVNQSPLLISFLGTKHLNVGSILAMLPKIKAALNPLQSSIKETRASDE